jgi:O-methyltransferase
LQLLPEQKSWTLDWKAPSPTVRSGASDARDCIIRVSASDLDSLLRAEYEDNAVAEFFALQVKILTADGGEDFKEVAPAAAQQLMLAFLSAAGARGSLQNSLYHECVSVLPNPRLTFMNFGYDVAEEEDYSWLSPEDYNNRYAINLLRHVTLGVAISGKRVLDIGCGRGGACSFLVNYTDAAEIIGMDYCAPQVRWCIEKYEDERLSFIQGDAQALPFPDKRFDVVINLESSHCYPDLFRFFAETLRVLVPGGYFCYADSTEFEADWFARALESVSFRVLRCCDITSNVALALYRNRETMARLYKEAADSSLPEEVIEQSIRQSNAAALGLFKNRQMLYHSILAQRP